MYMYHSRATNMNVNFPAPTVNCCSFVKQGSYVHVRDRKAKTHRFVDEGRYRRDRRARTWKHFNANCQQWQQVQCIMLIHVYCVCVCLCVCLSVCVCVCVCLSVSRDISRTERRIAVYLSPAQSASPGEMHKLLDKFLTQSGERFQCTTYETNVCSGGRGFNALRTKPRPSRSTYDVTSEACNLLNVTQNVVSPRSFRLL